MASALWIRQHTRRGKVRSTAGEALLGEKHDIDKVLTCQGKLFDVHASLVHIASFLKCHFITCKHDGRLCQEDEVHIMSALKCHFTSY